MPFDPSNVQEDNKLLLKGCTQKFSLGRRRNEDLPSSSNLFAYDDVTMAMNAMKGFRRRSGVKIFVIEEKKEGKESSTEGCVCM